MCAALLIAVVVGACADRERLEPVSGAAPPPTVVAPLDPAELEPLVVDVAPSGFTLADDDVGGTGATDLDDAGDPDTGAALAEAGFVRGWQRLWVSDDGDDELLAVVYEFADAAGAQAFFGRMAGGAAEEGGEGVFAVPGMPEAVGVSASGDGLEVTAVTTTIGPYLVQVVGDGPVPGPSQGTVVALAAAQVARLA